jgi:hypothetical protein
MSVERNAAIEHLLARLYTDAAVREAFLQDSGRVCEEYGITGDDAEAFSRMRPEVLQRAARTYRKKLEFRSQAKRGWMEGLKQRLGLK